MAAALRMPATSTWDQRTNRAREVMSGLRIEALAGKRIGEGLEAETRGCGYA